jgi:hypothetical protein
MLYFAIYICSAVAVIAGVASLVSVIRFVNHLYSDSKNESAPKTVT